MFDAIRHKVYLWAQQRQSWAKRSKDPSFRTLRYLSEIRDWMPGLWAWPEPVLCLGPRNELELGYLRKAGMDFVVGLDLFSQHPDILVGDMHALKFPDNSFGMVWASHVLEHARDPERVLGEIRRVLKPGGWLFASYPTDFQITWHDRHDYGHPVNLLTGYQGLGPGRNLFSHYTRNGDSAEWSTLIRIGGK